MAVNVVGLLGGVLRISFRQDLRRRRKAGRHRWGAHRRFTCMERGARRGAPAAKDPLAHGDARGCAAQAASS